MISNTAALYKKPSVSNGFTAGALEEHKYLHSSITIISSLSPFLGYLGKKIVIEPILKCQSSIHFS